MCVCAGGVVSAEKDVSRKTSRERASLSQLTGEVRVWVEQLDPAGGHCEIVLHVFL